MLFRSKDVGYNDDGGNYDTAGIWFDGFSTKLSVSVGISRWVDVKINGNLETIQVPVDNIDNSGNDYGAQYPFGIWDKFMQLMQSTPFGGDTAFTAAVPNPNATVMNSPTPSASATTPTATVTTTKAVVTSAPATSASASPSNTLASASPSVTCAEVGVFGGCLDPTSSSASASASATNTGNHGNGNNGGG